MTDGSSAEQAEGRYALLIANSKYSDPRLKPLTSPNADARGLATVFGDPYIGGFEVSTLADESWSRTQVEIARFCSSRARNDLALIYYTGHGVRDDNGVLHFCSGDTSIDLISVTGISGPFLIDQLSMCRSRRKVLILDTVFSGSVLQGVRSIPGDLVILAASGPLEYSFEIADHQESVFTHHLIEGLRTGMADLDGDGSITFDELLTYAKGHVEDEVDHQRPRMFSFVERPIVAAKVARHIFISYSRANRDLAVAVKDKLVSGGHKIWMDDQGIMGGDDWRDRIGTAIDEAKAVVVILSPEAFSSTWVRRELHYADKAGKSILPILSERCDIPPWYELEFGDVQRLDWGPTGEEGESNVLLESVKRVLSVPPTKEK